MDSLVHTLFNSLWVGDVFTKWNDCQVLMLLYELKEENLNRIIKKVKKEFESLKDTNNLKLNIKINIIK